MRVIGWLILCRSDTPLLKRRTEARREVNATIVQGSVGPVARRGGYCEQDSARGWMGRWSMVGLRSSVVTESDREA